MMERIDKAKFISREYKPFLEFWKTQLSIPDNGFYFSEKSEGSKNDKEVYEFVLDGETSAKIIDLVKGNDTGILFVLLSGLNALLSRYKGEEVVIIDTPLIDAGNLQNTYASKVSLINKVAGENSMRQLLLDTKQVVADSYKFQNYPVTEMLSSDLPEKDVRLTNVSMYYSKVHSVIESAENYDLVIAADRIEDHFSLRFMYNPAVFSSEFIQGFATHYHNFLSAFKDPSLIINTVDFLTKTEIEKLITDFNKTDAKYPVKLLQELFEEQVKLNGEQIALRCEGRSMSYQELNDQANKLAHYLKEQTNVQREEIVGILVDRSEKMLVAILAILKAGGCYLPIDPYYPQDRIDYMLEDSGCKTVITFSEYKEKIGSLINVIDMESEAIQSSAEHNPEYVNKPNDRCYIIYTSGSTGRPKGVMISHHNVVRLLFNEKIQFDFNDKDTWSLFHSYCFDFSVWEMYGALLYGGKLVIVPKVVAQNPKEFVELVSKEGVTILNQTPGAFYNFIEAEQERGKQNLKLRHIIFGGEALHPSRLKNWKVRYPHVKLINMYGITETTVHVTYKEIGDKEIAEGISNIGVPIPTLTCYVLDKQQQLQPIGVAGELCVGGEGLSSGYLNRDELTKEKFIVHPFMEGEKLYRSGDLARWLPNGELEYLGRIDHQVKIRGFRIELGEIEKVLDSHPNIKQAVVIDKEDKNGEKFLCAYIVIEGATELLNSDLREHLGKQLPDYMIPSHFIKMESIPLTGNGKVSRKELPEPDGTIVSGVAYKAPSNETEETIAKIWEEILSIDRVGVNDNFFDLGGHSLKASQVIATIQKHLNVELPLSAIFNNPNVEGLSAVVNSTKDKGYTPITRVEDAPYYPLSSSQRRMFVLHQFRESGLTYNMPRILEIKGKLDANKVEQAFRFLIQRQENLRTSFDFENEEPVQYIHESVDFKLEKFKAKEEEVENIISAFVKPFDLSKAPLLRAGVIELSSEKNILLFDMHHIVSDGVSMDILIDEFVKVYKGEALPEIEFRYRDYAVWQQNLVNSGKMEEIEKFWISQFEGEIPVLNMPTDYPRPAIQQFNGTQVFLELPEDKTLQLKTLARETGTTLFQLLLATYNVLLHRYTGQEDIVVGAPVAGRTTPGIENTIGIFINTLAIRNYPESKKSFKTFLNETKQTVLNCIENQDYQFESLVEKLKLARDARRNPLFDTMFTFGKDNHSHHVLDGLEIQPYYSPRDISKFDITMGGVEEDDKLFFTIEYCTHLFKKETMERFSSHFELVLNSILSNPDILLSDISILDEVEKEKILITFNKKQKNSLPTLPVIALFEQITEQMPNQAALVSESKSLTYSELNVQANRLAHKLKESGVTKDSIVNILLEPSVEMFIGILAVLKAGGAYLPIDILYPKARIEYIMKDANARWLLTRKEFSDDLDFTGEVIDLTENTSFENYSSSNPNSEISLNDLAYVIYTSGSTGKPKGVAVEHGSLLTFSTWVQEEFKVTDKDRVTKFAGIGFDASIFEIFPAMISGASMYIVPENIRLDMNGLNNYFESNGVSISFLPTQIAEQFMEVENNSLRVLLTGGDKLKSFKKRSYQLVDNYGPTENTVVASSFKVDDFSDNIPIGKPIAGTSIYMLDKHGNLQPVGIPGELCIAGNSLARGYLNQPELTAEKFVTNPFDVNERMYRTGDLARWLPDGNIEFLGRIDQQVKIRGYRIELGEIENQLLKHPQVEKAVVIDRKQVEANDKYICAYIVFKEVVSFSDLRLFLKNELPEYMIPSVFVPLNEIPLTANGKIDKAKLLAISLDESVMSSAEYIEPVSDDEKRLAAIWSQILGIEKIGVKDNFFELGGNSIKIIKMLRLIEQDYPGVVQIGNLYDNPTIEQLCLLISNAELKEENQEEQAIRIVEF